MEYLSVSIMKAIEKTEEAAEAGWIEMNGSTFRTLERQLSAVPMSAKLLRYHVEQDNSVGFYNGLPIFISEKLGENIVVVPPRLPK